MHISKYSNDENIARKLQPKEANNRILSGILKYHIHGLCAFCNIVIDANIL